MIAFPTTAAPVVAATPPQPPSQNLFEYVAMQAHRLPDGAGPAQLGSEILEGLRGFVDRVGRHERPDAAVRPTDSPERDGAFRPDAGEERMLRLVESLGRTFDYSTEVALVVRNVSGVSSSVGTLLRGQ